MTPERHQQICDLLYEALELEPQERDAFLNRVCAADPPLLKEVESLLESSDDVRSTFLQSSTLRLTLEPGTKLGDYQVESWLGAGGMGEVYCARDLSLPRKVAIKVLPSYFSSDPEKLRRFQQEAFAAGALNHPNILAVIHFGEYEGAPYLVSELLEGETLRDYIKTGPIPPGKARDFALQIARGLAAAHEKGIVHRDLKPENIFVTVPGYVKILDFGLAKLIQLQPRSNSSSHAGQQVGLPTQPGIIMGTVGYMSPEQVRGQAADTRSDIFAFGAVLYEMLTGKRAFQADTSADTMSAILNHNPPSLPRMVRRLSPAFQQIVEHCLKKKAEQRFQNTSELVQVLETLRINPDHSSYRAILAFATMLIVVLSGLAFKNQFVERIRELASGRPHLHTSSRLQERNLTANLPDNPVRTAALSRDGKLVIYTDNSPKAHLLQVDTGEVRQISLDSSYEPAAWFPDGVQLLVKGGHGRLGIWKFSTWDSGLKKLFDGPVFNLVVSPDGSTVAFVNGEDRREIWLMGAEGEEPHKIAEFGAEDSLWGLAWSPDGHRLAYVRIRGTFPKHESMIETADLNFGNRTLLLSDPKLWGREGVWNIVWLFDGRVVYSISTQQDEYNLWSIMTNHEHSAPLSQPQAITDLRDLAISGFQSSGDGTRMIAVKSHSDDGVFGGRLVAGRLNVKRLSLDSWRNAVTAWSRDSRSILFFSKRNGRWAICRQDISDLHAEVKEMLVLGPENYRDPVVSASGKLLFSAFTSANADNAAGNWRLMSTPIEGGPRSTLMSGRYTYHCSYLGSSPCFVGEQRDNQLILSRLDPDKGKGEEVGRVSDYRSAIALWSISPDAAKVALVDLSKEEGTIRILNLGNQRISELPLQDWKWQTLTSIGWGADLKQLYATVSSDSSYALVSVAPDGAVKTLYEVTPEQGWLGSPYASPDGQWLAFTKRTYVRDLILLENF